MSEFEKLCEQHGILKTVRNERYPSQIKFSKEFMESLAKEFYSNKLKLDEDKEKPIRNYQEKFNKALRFEISHLNQRADVELETMRAKFDAEADTSVAIEQNNQRVPEVKVDGKQVSLPQNDAPKDYKLKQDTCKQKRLVLKRNAYSNLKESGK